MRWRHQTSARQQKQRAAGCGTETGRRWSASYALLRFRGGRSKQPFTSFQCPLEQILGRKGVHDVTELSDKLAVLFVVLELEHSCSDVADQRLRVRAGKDHRPLFECGGPLFDRCECHFSLNVGSPHVEWCKVEEVLRHLHFNEAVPYKLRANAGGSR